MARLHNFTGLHQGLRIQTIENQMFHPLNCELGNLSSVYEGRGGMGGRCPPLGPEGKSPADMTANCKACGLYVHVLLMRTNA